MMARRRTIENHITDVEMNRRQFLQAGTALLPLSLRAGTAGAEDVATQATEEFWKPLAAKLGHKLQPVDWPIAECLADPAGRACADFFRSVRNPYFLGDHAGLTQSFGWVGAWTTAPSDRVVIAESADDIASAVGFAREKGIRIAVKGGGHSYKGGSNAEGSLLVWTRHMRSITLHDTFTPLGTAEAGVPAVSVGAGAMWGDVYRAVSVEAGRYVQGGGCLTVGVAGLVQGGGFGSLSKAYGIAAASLLEAEIVTADGTVRVVNAVREPDLFFALKGGGGGSWGIVSRLTLKTHALPATIGAVFLKIRARDAGAYPTLVSTFLAFYRDALFNRRWGEQVRFAPDNTLAVSMLFSDLAQAEAEGVWAPFLAEIQAQPSLFEITEEPQVIAVPGRSFWDPAFLKTLPGVVLSDDRPGADPDRIFWASNREEAGQVIHAYQSAWIPARHLDDGALEVFSEAIVAASRHWSLSLHANKGLAGAPDAVREAAKATAMNPAVTEAFALAICGAEGPPAYPGIAGHEPERAQATQDARRVSAAMGALKAGVETTGCYLAESDFFEPGWQQAFWGDNHDRLAHIKRIYDPTGFFIVHHGIESGG